MGEYISKLSVIEILENAAHRYNNIGDKDSELAILRLIPIVRRYQPDTELGKVGTADWIIKNNGSYECSNCGCNSSKNSRRCPDCGYLMRLD